MFVCCKCCVLSGRGLCDELITRPEESYRLWCVVVCDLENLKNEEALTRIGSQRHKKKNKISSLRVCFGRMLFRKTTVVSCVLEVHTTRPLVEKLLSEVALDAWMPWMKQANFVIVGIFSSLSLTPGSNKVTYFNGLHHLTHRP